MTNECSRFFHKGKCVLLIQVPSWIKMVAPKGSLEIEEEAWNAYPYCKTVLSNPGYMKVS